MATKGIQELSVDTSLLVERLRKVTVGETVTWDELSAAISRDVRTQAISNLSSARRIARRDYSLVFSTIPKVGLKRLDDNGIVATADNSLIRIHREAKRGTERLSCVSDFEKLDNPTKIKLNAARAGLGALHEITKTKSIAKLEKAVAKSASVLPLVSTLAAFSNGKE